MGCCSLASAGDPFITTAQCYTLAGKAEFEPAIASNLQSLEKEKKEITRTLEVSAKPVNNAAIQTYFRSNYRNHIHLSAIADRKAQMLISVNAILISVLISISELQQPGGDPHPRCSSPSLFSWCWGWLPLIFSVISAARQ